MKTDQQNDKYHRILEAAIKVFAEQGFHNSTISQVAREAGVADGTIYIYFKNKADILSHFFTYKSRIVFDRFHDVVEQAGSAEEKLRCLVKSHLTEFQNDRNMAVVFQCEALMSRYVNEEYIREITKNYLGLLDSIIRQGQAEGSIRKDLPRGLVKRFILGAVNEVINTWVVTGGKTDISVMVDPLVELFFEGIGMPAAA